MTATTVPPPGLLPIGAPELRANTRRFFSRAFAVSGAAHLAVLGAVLWLRASAVDTEPRWILTPAYLVPPPNIAQPITPNRPSVGAPQIRDNGIIDPTEEMDPNLVDPKVGMKPIGVPGAETGKPPQSAPTVEPASEGDPTEVAFVAYDRAPIPYFRPEPSYPGWARDAGIEGRVVLHALIGRDGRVARITVLRDVKGLTDAAREAIARWLFHPARSGKNPVAVWVEIPIDFKL